MGKVLILLGWGLSEGHIVALLGRAVLGLYEDLLFRRLDCNEVPQSGQALGSFGSRFLRWSIAIFSGF